MKNVIGVALALSVLGGFTYGLQAKTAAAVTATSEAQAVWTRYVNDDFPNNAVVYKGVVVFDALHLHGDSSAEGFALRTGALLWKRTGVSLLSGTPLFLAVGQSVERIDARTGRTIWRSAPLCTETPDPNAGYTPPKVSIPTYAAIVANTLYVGCNGGKISALNVSSGRVLASRHPAYVDTYDEIIALGDDTLAISGEASGAYLYRQSAIVKQDSLVPIVVFTPDHRVLGSRGATAVVADVCCQGTHSDSWPADIDIVSLSSGKTGSAARLHPYAVAPSSDADRPGAGVVLAYGNTLYVGTHSALFTYDLQHLSARPRIVLNDLADLPSVIDNRYLVVEERGPLKSRKATVLDTHTGLPVTLPRANMDASCRVRASGSKYVFAVCTSLDIASAAHLGGPAKALTVGMSTENPASIAVYALSGP